MRKLKRRGRNLVVSGFVLAWTLLVSHSTLNPSRWWANRKVACEPVFMTSSSDSASGIAGLIADESDMTLVVQAPTDREAIQRFRAPAALALCVDRQFQTFLGGVDAFRITLMPWRLIHKTYRLSAFSVAASSLCRLLMQLFGNEHLPRQPRRQSILRLVVFAGGCVLALFAGQACQKSDKPASGIVLTLIDQGWWVDKESRDRLSEELRLFTNESGIRVEVLPAPESAVEQLETWRKLLDGGATVPDVYAVDVIWPGILADHLLDLNSYIPADEIAAHFPEMIANNTVNGRLVALPYNMNIGVLLYRVDLLQQYGYRAPPRTWEELESMAQRIQAGERAKGNKEFWGFVWQGAPSEALTCNALEWQVSEGGGEILENGMITVNNPETIRAWERAARWVGSISPPGVVAYKEWDAFNVWQAGQTAFMRNWANAYVAAGAPSSPTRATFEIAPLPEGRAGLGATLGGHGYGVSRYSQHPREAAMLVRFLCRRDVQLRRCRKTAQPPTLPELYSDPEVLAANPYFSTILDTRKDIALRPAATSGKEYPDVSRAYFEAVHVVLTGKKSASQSAADLQVELQKITGLRAPSTGVNAKP